MGDILLTPGFKMSKAELRTLIGHEAQHRAQWAVLTVIGGPLAFPVAYGVDDFFFPGSRNHFERLAGLDAGRYAHVGTGPVLGPAQFAVLGALAAIIHCRGPSWRPASACFGEISQPAGRLTA